MDYEIRKIQPEDISQVFEQMLRLVKHEGIADRFQLTLKRMKQELFGKKADWHGLVAVVQKKVWGFCLYSFANTNRAFNLTPLIQIDDLFVHENYRNLGIGKRILNELGRIAVQMKIERIELWCIRTNLEAQNFYEKLNAEKLNFLDVLQLDPKNLIESTLK